MGDVFRAGYFWVLLRGSAAHGGNVLPIISTKTLLLGCGAGALDRSVSKETYLETASTPAQACFNRSLELPVPKSHDVDCSKFQWKC